MSIILLLKATVILGVASALTTLFRNTSAAVRHLIWTLAVCGVLALPVMSLVAPKWQVLPDSQVTRVAPVPSSAPAATMIRTPTTTRRHMTWHWSWVWYAGMGASGAWLLLGWLRASRLVRRSEPGPWRVEPIATSRRVRVQRSADITVPVTTGIFRPIILMPQGADAWPIERLTVVLAHELAHIERHDCLTQLLASIACAVYWFHPLAWFASLQLRRERERACDDAVINRGTKCSVYAEHLLGIATAMQSKGNELAMTIPFFRSQDLQQRLRDLLNQDANRRALSLKIVAGIAIAALCVIIPIATVSAQSTQAVGNISGTVIDVSGAVIPSVPVTASGLDTKNKEATRADAVGNYAFRNLPVGRYRVEVRARGFKLFQSEVAVTAGTTLPVRAILDLGTIEESVDVIAARPTSAVQPQTAGTPQRIRVGGNVQATKLIYKSDPTYPEHARQQGVEGSVVLRAVVGIDGSLMSVEPLSQTADSELVQAALDAVRSWRYEPTLLNGAPVEVVTTITVNFRLR
ncbi:MAG TPA: M56 family metallopeptidase [Bryobacteraceae bacterium]|nr:M56 family metallopeptidase [Bryobacteraceae bacterium]